MRKLSFEEILVKGARIYADSSEETNMRAKELVERTLQRQKEILKLKEIDEERLKMVIKL